MPNITQYNATGGPSDVPSSGAQAQVQAGRVIHTFLDQAGQNVGGAIARVGGQEGKRLDDANDVNDIVQGSLHALQTEQQLTKDHDALVQQATQADPANATPEQLEEIRNQRETASKQLETYLEDKAAPAMQAVADKYGRSDRSRLHMADQQIGYLRSMGTKFAADRAAASGQEVVSKLDDLMNTGVSAAVTDPRNADINHTQFLQTASTIINANQYLTAEQKATLTKHYSEESNSAYAKATVHGFLNQSTGVNDQGEATAKSLLDKGDLDHYFKPGEKDEMYAQVAEHTRARIAQNDHDVKQTSQNTIDGYTSQAFGKDGRFDFIAGASLAAKAKTDPNIRQEDKNKVSEFLRSGAELQTAEDNDFAGTIHDDPSVVFALLKGMTNGTTTLDSLGAAAKSRDITTSTLKEFAASLNKPAVDALKRVMNDEVVKARLSGGEDIIQGNIVKSATTPNVPGNLNRAVVQKQNQYKTDVLLKMREALMNGHDPRQFVDPKSKSYVDPTHYIPSEQEQADEMVKPPSPAADTNAPKTKPSLDDAGL